MATVPPILVWQPEGGVPVGPVSNPPVYSQAGTTQLINGQAYIDVVFGSAQTTDEWVLVECVVVNEIDATPLNIWPGIITDKLASGFRLQLNGMPDSGNYYLHWAVSGINIAPTPATTFILSGPTTGAVGLPSTFTVHLPTSTTVPTPVTVTPSDSGGGGTFSPTTVTLTTGAAPPTFTYTPVSAGTKTISVTNTGGLVNPADLSFLAVAYATGYSLAGPSTGFVSVASTAFTVTLTPPGDPVPATVTVTPSDGGGGGTFTPTSVTVTTAAPSATFTYTPASTGAKTISATNDGGLTNPANLTYTSSAFDPTGIAGLKLWLKADSLALSDGAAVTAWNDSSGNGYNLTSGSGATFKTNIVNAKPVVRFNGTTDSLWSTSDIGVSQPNTVFVVAKQAVPGSGELMMHHSFTGASTASQMMTLFTDGRLYLYAGAVVLDTINSTGAFHVFTGIFSGSNGTAYIDGGFRFGPSAIGASGVGKVNIMYDQSDTRHSVGDIAEILIYNSALSTTDRQNVELYLKGKYAIP